MNVIQKYKKWLILIVSLLAVVCFYYFFLKSPSPSEEISIEDEEVLLAIDDVEATGKGGEMEEIEPSIIVVDVKGGVQNPGVYEIHTDARVHEIIQKAGGLSENADEQAINLASRLEDGMVVYIPLIGENKENPFNASFKVEAEKEVKININLATSEELQTLPGIGPSKAESIISYREEHGRFDSVDELLEVTGIGQKSLEKFKNKLTVK